MMMHRIQADISVFVVFKPINLPAIAISPATIRPAIRKGMTSCLMLKICFLQKKGFFQVEGFWPKGVLLSRAALLKNALLRESAVVRFDRLRAMAGSRGRLFTERWAVMSGRIGLRMGSEL